MAFADERVQHCNALAEKYNDYKNTKKAIDDALEMLDDNPDDDFRALLKEELSENKERLATIGRRIENSSHSERPK